MKFKPDDMPWWKAAGKLLWSYIMTHFAVLTLFIYLRDQSPSGAYAQEGGMIVLITWAVFLGILASSAYKAYQTAHRYPMT